MTWLLPLLQLAFAVPALVMGCLRTEIRVRSALAVAGLFLAVAFAWRVPLLDGRLVIGGWNWIGKLLAFAIACAVLVVIRRRAGPHFVRLPARDGLRPVIYAGGALLVFAAIAGWFSRGAQLDLETLAFQATVPGLDEELAFRGIMLALLLAPNAPMRANVSALASITLLFGAVHGLALDRDGALVFEPGYFAWTAAAGALWGWMTIRTRSIVPGLLSHNATNTVGYLVSAT